MAARCCSGTPKPTKMGDTLVDHHQRHVVHLDQIARMHQQIAGAAGERGADLAVAQVQLGAFATAA